MTMVMVVSHHGMMCSDIGKSTVITMFARKPVWAVLITAIATLVAAFGGPLLANSLMSPQNLFSFFVGPVLSALIAVLLIWLLRRFVTRQPWSGVRLTWDRMTIPHFALGLGAALAAVLLANAAAVAVGVAGGVLVGGRVAVAVGVGV